MATTTKVYPRLERKKLKKIKEGKRPYDSLEDKAIYITQFERGSALSYGVIGVTLGYNGVPRYMSSPLMSITNGYDDGDVPESNPIEPVSSINVISKSEEFPDVDFNMADMLKLREAYFKGTLEKTFAKMVENKMNQGGNA